MAIGDVVNISTPTANSVPTGLTVSGSGLTVSNGMVSAYITLTWTAITADTFDHYKLRYKKNAFTYYNYIDVNENTITIDGLTPNTQYNFAIASVNKHGTLSSYSATVNGTTPVNDTPPAVVAGVSALGGIQYAIIEWTANSETDLSHYEVYRSETNNSATGVKVANVSGTNFVNGNLTGGTTYYYWLKAVNTSGYSSDFSTVASATPRNVASTDNQISSIGWVQDCVFSSTNNTTVAWTTGTFKTSADVTYNILTGNTGVMAARTYIYLDIAVSTTEYQTTTTATNAVGDNKVLIGVAENVVGVTKDATFQIFGGAGGQSPFIDSGNIVAGSITTNEIAANTIVAGNIAAGTISATEIDTTSITSLSNLVVSADKILLDGTTYISSWRKAGDLTKIDGGLISTNTITTTQLNFTPVQGTNVIASINASTEGITIDADNISISGSTTFSSGYDPTGRVLAVGGTYDSAASGARVRIFPDANTGLQVIDDGGNDVFKTIIGGTHIGDVYLGDYTNNQGLFYDKSATKFYFKGELVAPSGTLGTITAGTLSGVSLSIGSSNSIFKADSNGIYLGHDTFASAPFRVNMSGDLTVTGANITGGTIQTSSSANTGAKLTSSGLTLYGQNVLIYYGSTSYGKMGATDGYFGFESVDNRNIKIKTDDGTTFFEVNSGAGIAPLTSGQGNCGLSSQYWANVYTNNVNLSTGTINYQNGSVSVNDDFAPTDARSYNSGSSSYMWSNVYSDAYQVTKNGYTTKYITMNTSNNLETNTGLYVGGALSKASGSFTIDHPLKPDTHFLQHSFVESPDMLNIYRGNGEIVSGECKIGTPDWFVPLNGNNKDDYSYQLTSIGQQNDLWVKTEMNNGEVVFAGNKDGKFSYIITAIRHDDWAENNRIVVELEKDAEKKQQYKDKIKKLTK